MPWWRVSSVWAGPALGRPLSIGMLTGAGRAAEMSWEGLRVRKEEGLDKTPRSTSAEG